MTPALGALETAPRRVGSCRHTPDGCHGFGVQTRSMALVPDTRTLSAIQNQNTGGTSTWLEAIARACPNIRFGFRIQYRSGRGSFSKSSFVLIVCFSLVGPPTEESPHRVRLGCRENRKRHLSQRRCQLILSVSCKTSEVLSTLAFISLHTVRMLCSPAAFRLRNQQQQSSNVGAFKPWEVDAQERSLRARRLLLQAALWASSMAERDIILEASKAA